MSDSKALDRMSCSCPGYFIIAISFPVFLSSCLFNLQDDQKRPMEGRDGFYLLALSSCCLQSDTVAVWPPPVDAVGQHNQSEVHAWRQRRAPGAMPSGDRLAGPSPRVGIRVYPSSHSPAAAWSGERTNRSASLQPRLQYLPNIIPAPAPCARRAYK